MRVAPSRPRGASSSGVPPPSSSIGTAAAETSGTAATETSGTAADADVPPPTASDDSEIRRTLDHVLTVLAAQGQILVDVLDKIRALHGELV